MIPLRAPGQDTPEGITAPAAWVEKQLLMITCGADQLHDPSDPPLSRMGFINGAKGHYSDTKPDDGRNPDESPMIGPSGMVLFTEAWNTEALIWPDSAADDWLD